MNASVSGIHFVDLDLDETQLGGNISWTAPADPSRVQETARHVFNGDLTSACYERCPALLGSGTTLHEELCIEHRSPTVTML